MFPFCIVCKLVFVPTELRAERGRQNIIGVVPTLLITKVKFYTTQIIRVLQAFWFIWSSTSSSNCSIFLEYSSNLKFVILLSSSNCSNLFVLFSANVLVSLTLVSISFSLLFSWSNFLFIVSLILVVTITALAEISWAKTILVHQSFSSFWPFWSKVGEISKSQLLC